MKNKRVLVCGYPSFDLERYLKWLYPHTIITIEEHSDVDDDVWKIGEELACGLISVPYEDVKNLKFIDLALIFWDKKDNETKKIINFCKSREITTIIVYGDKNETWD